MGIFKTVAVRGSLLNPKVYSGLVHGKLTFSHERSV